uniref:Transferrin receptor 2 n=1 Tax=Neolamprologus brichardi TaxID=32507 RepID=A0A3Q4GUU9_NEOBR
PGSSEGTSLASEILQRFRELQMDHTWTESLYSEKLPHIQDRPSQLLMYVSLQGGVVYANYGRPEDFKWLKREDVSVAGCVVVMRVGGGVSFAEKVWLAEKNGASGALIYPDPADVHLGSGDPFTPGFPSFNHTQFPPIQSSGLPLIPALPITATVASKLQLTGPSCPRPWQGRLPYVRCTGECATVVNLSISLSDQYIILGAQRDSLGPGAVKSGVGTAILLELARTFSAMVKKGFSPRRSLLFVSWDAGDFGNVGATEWLEVQPQQIQTKPNLSVYQNNCLTFDLPLTGLSVHASPEGCGLLQSGPGSHGLWSHSWMELIALTHLLKKIMLTLFFWTQSPSGIYTWTTADLCVHAMEMTHSFAINTGELVGEMVLRLAHDHILPLRITSYAQTVLQFSSRGLSPQWVFSARGDYSRAAETLQRAIDYSDLHEPTITRFYNTRIMKVEYYFLSQYVSAVETPFRHVIHGRGNHTLSALTEHLGLLTSDPGRFDESSFRRQLALFTWTLQGAANALNGDVWSIHNMHRFTH